MAAQPGNVIHLPLSPDQQAQIKRTIGRTGETLELTVEELEARIVPKVMTNHNEPILRSRQIRSAS
jgi:hypothetical protein